ncbi:hypothetical protein D9M71_277720 [compost metagenome]
MQVTVYAHDQATHGLLAQGIDLGKQVLALLEQFVDYRAVALLQVAAMLFQQLQGVLQLAANALVPGLAVLARTGPWTEIGVVGRCRQQQVHLAQALPEQRGKCAQFGQCIGVLLLFGMGRRHFIADRPFQVVLGPVPGVALVAQVALGDHQQVWHALRVDAADRTQQGRDIGKAGLGQIRAHFQLRVHPSTDPANHLQHQAAADHHRAVRLLGRQIAHRRIVAQFQAGQLLGGLEDKLTLGRGQTRGRLHALDQGPDEALEAERIGDQADLAAPANPGQGQLLRQGAADLFLGEEAERHLVAAGLASPGDFDFAEQHRVVRGIETHAISNAHLLDGHILAGEPAPLGQVLQQGIVFQRTARRLLQQLFHAFFQDQRGEVRHALRRLDVPARHLVFRRQQEPVEAIGRQGQQERQLADGREGTAPEHFHRDHVGVVGKLEFSRLCGPRYVSHAQDDFSLAIGAGVLADIRQDAPVARRQHGQAATAEGLLLLTHGEQAAIPVEQRMGVARLGLDVDGQVAVERVHDRRQYQARRVSPGKATVAVDRPLRGRAHTVAIAQVDIVAHADFIAVVQGRRAWHR